MPWRLELGRGLVSCLGGFACLSWKSQLKGIAEDNFGVNNLCIQSSYLKKKKKKEAALLRLVKCRKLICEVEVLIWAGQHSV